jgi:DNA polymerase
MASTIFNVSPADVSGDQWLKGKIAFLALNSPMSAKRFRETCYQWGLRLTAEFSEKLVSMYRAQHPCIASLGRELQDGAVRAVMERTSIQTPRRILFRATEDWLTMRLPSGRLCWYYQPRAITNPTYWGTELVVKCVGFYEDGRPSDYQLYGARLVTNLVGGTAWDIKADAMARLGAAGYPVVLVVEDQIVTEPEIGFGSIEQVLEILRTPPSWAPRLPLAAEGWEGPRYR